MRTRETGRSAYPIALLLLSIGLVANQSCEQYEDSKETFHYGTSITHEGGGIFTITPSEEVKVDDGKDGEKLILPEEFVIDWGDGTFEEGSRLKPLEHEYTQNGGRYTIRISAKYVENGKLNTTEVYKRDVQVGPNDMLPQDGSVLGLPYYDIGDENPLCDGIKTHTGDNGLTTVDFTKNYLRIGDFVLGYGVNWGDGNFSLTGPPRAGLQQSHTIEADSNETREPYASFTLKNGTVVECQLKRPEQNDDKLGPFGGSPFTIIGE